MSTLINKANNKFTFSFITQANAIQTTMLPISIISTPSLCTFAHSQTGAMPHTIHKESVYLLMAGLSPGPILLYQKISARK